MTAPVVTAVAAGSWVKVATNVTDVSITPLTGGANYAWTYRDTGDPAPTLANERLPMDPKDGITLQSTAAMDVYVWVLLTSYITTANVRVDVGLNKTYLIDG